MLSLSLVLFSGGMRAIFKGVTGVRVRVRVMVMLVLGLVLVLGLMLGLGLVY